MKLSTKATIILIIVVLIVVYAVFAEFKDYRLLEKRPPLSLIASDEDKNKELLFYSCFNYENNIQWRSIFATSALATLIIGYILHESYSGEIRTNTYVLILLVIFFAFFGSYVFKTFHMYRPMCGKVKPENTIL